MIAKTAMFERAIGKIKQGWCQDSYGRTETGSVALSPTHPDVRSWCINGACVEEDELYGTNDYETAARPFIAQAIKEMYPTVGYTNVAAWNDTPGRTQEEVLAVLTRCKELVEEA